MASGSGCVEWAFFITISFLLLNILLSQNAPRLTEMAFLRSEGAWMLCKLRQSSIIERFDILEATNVAACGGAEETRKIQYQP